MLWPLFIIGVLCGFSGSNVRMTTSRVHMLLLIALGIVVVHELARPQTVSSGSDDRAA